MSDKPRSSFLSGLSIIGPGILVAATGVGAGDLATATFTGAKLGMAILWAVIVGAVLKYALNEGLTRWQLATGTTILQGAVRHLPKWAQWLFMIYLIIWSYLVAMALMSACGVAAYAIYPIFEDPSKSKIFYGIAQSLIAAVLVMFGGYSVFEKVMSVCIGMMFLVVCGTAIALAPPLGEFLAGLVIPTIPEVGGEGLNWTVALLGGIGGTVTILCYGYWIREESRTQWSDLRTCRIDLAIGYGMTAIFGLAMVVIGSQLNLEGKGATLVIDVAETLEAKLGALGAIAKWAFFVGAWGAFFSSLLGVWQSVPYLFTDFWRLLLSEQRAAEDKKSSNEKLSDSNVYSWHLAVLAIAPISGLIWVDFTTAMLVNGVVGALFIPIVASALLVLNNRTEWIGEKARSGVVVNGLLVIALLFFLWALGSKLWAVGSKLM